MKKQKELVVKSNQLIESRYNITALGAKVYSELVTKIKKEDKAFKKYPFKLNELAKTLNVGERNYEIIKRTTKKMAEKCVEIRDGSILLQVCLLSSAKYDEKKGVLNLCFDPELKPYLLQLKDNFTKYQLENIQKMRSFYSIRIYELLKQYEKIGYRKFKLTAIKNVLGIEKKQYKNFNDFKRFVITIAQKELKEKADIYFELETEKTKNKVTSINFIIKSNVKEKIDETKKQTIQISDKLKKLIDYIPEEHRYKKTILKTVEKAYQQHGQSYVLRNIKYTNKNCNKNYRAYLIKALQEDWGSVLEEDEKIKQIQQKKQREKKTLRYKLNAGDMYCPNCNQKLNKNDEECKKCQAEIYWMHNVSEKLKELKTEAL